MKYLNLAAHVVKNMMLEILIIIIDLSGSMNIDDWKPSRKAGAIKANKELIKVKAKHHPQDMVGIIGFGTMAEVLHEPVCLANEVGSLNRALKRLPDLGYTNFNAALELAETCLFEKSVQDKKDIASKGVRSFLSWLLYDPPTKSSHYIKENSPNNGCVRRIILLTDGDWNEGGSPLRIARRLKDAGVVIDCIGIGGSPEDVEADKLRPIASRNSDGSIRYCFIGDQQQLIKKYESLAHHIRPV